METAHIVTISYAPFQVKSIYQGSLAQFPADITALKLVELDSVNGFLRLKVTDFHIWISIFTV